MPFFDPDTNLLYVAGKGDCNIRYYEITESEPLIHYVDQFTAKEPQRGLASRHQHAALSHRHWG
jgi:hypothetical protein